MQAHWHAGCAQRGKELNHCCRWAMWPPWPQRTHKASTPLTSNWHKLHRTVILPPPPWWPSPPGSAGPGRSTGSVGPVRSATAGPLQAPYISSHKMVYMHVCVCAVYIVSFTCVWVSCSPYKYLMCAMHAVLRGGRAVHTFGLMHTTQDADPKGSTRHIMQAEQDSQCI